MQIAGSQCRNCKGLIVLATDGKSCEHCGSVVHLNCEPALNCSICGQPFDFYQPSRRDRFWNAYDPREKQARNAEGPLLALLLAALVTLLAFYLMTLT
jgi:hypothetical protein